MITHKEIPGGGGGEARWDGRYVSNFRDGSPLEYTGGNRLACPPGSNVLYPRVPPVGEFKIIGQCSPDNCHSTWEWTAGVGWVDRGESIGVSPAIYDYDGRLFLVTPGGPYGTSQGFRYVTLPNPTFPGGMVVLGDHTMSAAPDGRLIHEYTSFGVGYTGGQGHDEGTHIVTPDGHRFILQHGDNRFTRWTYDPASDTLAVAISNLSRQSVEFWWMRLADIYTLEAFVPPIGPRPPDPPKPVAPPKFTIASPTFPVTGEVTLDVTCVYADEAGGGALDWMEWQIGPSATGPWTVEATRPGTEHAYTYHFARAGIAFIKARGGNKAGTHETGAERKVTVTEPVPPIIPPEPPIEPPVTDHYRLATVHGGYLAVGADHVLHEAQTATPFEVVDAETHVGLKAPSGFVAAEPDGRLIANRGTIGDWERFTQTALADGRWQFKSDAWETYISAHDDGTVRADQSVAGGWETFTPTTAPPPPHGGPISTLHAEGPLFRQADGTPWRLMGVSAFKLARLYADGDDITPFLRYFSELGANTLRVWPYVPWPTGGWVSPTNTEIIQFVSYVRAAGFYTYLTLLTSDEASYIPWAKGLVHDLTAAQLDSLLIEIGNEPQINKHIDVWALKGVCDASGYLYTSGEYDDSAKWFGRFLDAHTPRDSEWPRKCHDLLEYYQGGGPSYPTEPAVQVPCIAGEPIRADQAGFNHDDAVGYYAGCSLLGAGGILHYEGGKYGRLPDANEAQFIAGGLTGLRAFPADCWFAGPYERIDEQGQTLRTYKRGPYVDRIRPVSGPILIGAIR